MLPKLWIDPVYRGAYYGTLLDIPNDFYDPPDIIVHLLKDVQLVVFPDNVGVA